MTEQPGIYDVDGSETNEPPRFEEHLVHTTAGIRITVHLLSAIISGNSESE